MRLSRLIFAMLLLLAAGLPAWAATSSADVDHVRVELLVFAQGLNRGDATDAGVYFKLEPGWHIYWKNPGDAGLPPHVLWTLPGGITAGPMEFPAPKRLPLGPLMDFGYEDEVLFPLKLHVANSAKAGPVTLHAKVDWLVCQERCIPGKAELEVSRNVLDRPGKAVAIAADAAILKRFVARLPKPLPASDKAVFQPAPVGFRLVVETGQRETGAAFFPSDQDILDNPAAQKPTPTATGVTLDLKKDAGLAANPAQLKGVLELSGGRAYEIAALLSGGAAASASVGEPAEKQASAGKAPGDAAVADARVKTPAVPAPITALPLSWALLAYPRTYGRPSTTPLARG